MGGRLQIGMVGEIISECWATSSGIRKQVSIKTKDGHKYSLLWVIHNSYDAYMKILGQPEKALGQF